MLETRDLTAFYGDFQALFGVSLRVAAGECVGLAGLAGSGKSEIGDAIAGRTQLFTREDTVEETWRIVQPLLDEPGPVLPYEPGTWGPPEAEKLTRGICQWHEPWLT